MSNTTELAETIVNLSDQGLFNVIANSANDIATMTKNRKIILEVVQILVCLKEFERRVKEQGVTLDV